MSTKEKKTVPPKLNKFMHPRNPYKTPPSFKKLALDYPEFRSHCIHDISGKVHLNFKNPKALRALTTCLLHQDFGLQVNIPEDRLVPTLPLRLNYLLWLEDLLYLAARRHGSGGGGEEMTVVGADIGTGAACVYPLLGAAQFGWCMLATETDSISYTSALSNVQRNELTGQVVVKKVEEKTILKGVLDHPDTLPQVLALTPSSRSSSSKLKPHSAAKSSSPSKTKSWGEFYKGGTKEGKNGHNEEETNKEEKNGKEEKRDRESPRDYLFDFTMTNPPFFSTEEEMDTMAKSKKTRGEPTAAPTGSTQEKVTEGGEVEFIRQMVKESHLLKDKVRIFTTLIGTKAHVQEVRRLVEAENPTSSVFTEFCQGRTMRWGAAWTFAAGVSLSEVRSKKEMATNKPIVLLLPRSLMSVYSVQAAWAKVQDWLKALKVKVEVFKSSKYFVSANIKAFKLTWLHQRRRRREKQREGQHHHHHHHHHNGKNTKGEEGSSKKTEEEEGDKKRTRVAREEDDALVKEETEEEREKKRPRIETEDEEKPEVRGLEEEEKERPKIGTGEKMEEEEEEEEEDLEEEEEEEEAKQTNKDEQEAKTDTWDIKKPKKGPKCKLRCNFQVKQTGGLISLEAYYLSGSLGKDGLNQLVQYMRNQLTKPPE